MRYRPEIDGMRAIAVLSVLIFHVFPEVLPGGFVGVDIFFVISGYLITGIILKSSDEGRFSLLEFWKRRVKRLAPAMLLVTSVTLVVGYFMLLPEEFYFLGRQLCSLYLLMANYFFYNESGYWEPQAEDMALLHTWSLGVEEQFYIVYVLVMSLLLRFVAKKFIYRFLILLAVSSYVLCFETSMTNVDAAFYLLPYRIWEMLAGSIVAFSLVRNSSGSRVACMLGASLVLLSVVLIRPEQIFPGWVAILPVAGTCLLLSSEPFGWVKRLLENSLVVYFGKISYSLYLWHWIIIFYFGTYIFPQSFPVVQGLCVILCSIVLAALTYRFVENPIRYSNKKSHVVVIFLFASTTLLLSTLIGREQVTPHSKPMYSHGPTAEEVDYGIYKSWDTSGVKVFGNNEKVHLVLVGDSHARMYGACVHRWCQDEGVTFASMAASSAVSPWIDGYPGERWTIERREQLEIVRKTFIEQNRPRVVLVADRYEHLVNKIGKERFKNGYANYLEALLGKVESIIVLGQPPIAGADENVYKLVNKLGRGAVLKEDLNLNRLRSDGNNTLRDICASLGHRVQFIPTEDLFLSESGKIIFADSNGYLYYRDDDHLSQLGTEIVMPRIKEALEECLRETEAGESGVDRQ